MSKEEIKQIVSQLVDAQELRQVTVDVSKLRSQHRGLLKWDLNHVGIEWTEAGDTITVTLPEQSGPRHKVLEVLRLYNLEVRGL